MIKKVKKAIFPIAGLGTRFLPATKSIPKEMLTVLDRPVLEWSVIEASKSGIEEMIFVTSSSKNSIIEHFDNSPLLEEILRKKKKSKELKSIQFQNTLGNFTFILQDKPRGLGHAVQCASNLIDENENFMVILPDDIILSDQPATHQLIKVSEDNDRCSVIALEKVDRKEVSKYGVIDYKKKIGNSFKIISLVEKPKIKEAPSNLTVVGRYLLNSKIFKILKNLKPGTNNEIQLTDGLNYMIKEPGILGHKLNGNRFDCGNKLGFIQANLTFGMKDKEISQTLKGLIKKL